MPVLRILIAASLPLLAPGGLADPSLAWADAGETTHYYVSLGDSLAESYQPSGGLTHGYTEALFKEIRGDFPQLRHEKLGCGGETAGSMIDTSEAGFCLYPDGAFDTQSQLDVAVDFLTAHPAKVALITIDIAGNDVLACLDQTTLLLDQGCLDQSFPAALADLATVLTTLQVAAPGAPIVGMTYYDPFLGLWVLGPDARAVALHNAPIVADLNAQLTAAYQSAGVPVADVAGAFDSANFTDNVDTKEWGEIPVNVANVCQWTWFCDDKHAFDVHANTEGYDVIAQAFLEVVAASSRGDESAIPAATPSTNAFEADVRASFGIRNSIECPPDLDCGSARVVGFGKATRTFAITAFVPGVPSGCDTFTGIEYMTLDPDGSELELAVTAALCYPGGSHSAPDQGRSQGDPFTATGAFDVIGGTGIFEGASGNGTLTGLGAGDAIVIHYTGSITLGT